MTEALNTPEDYQKFYEDMARKHQLLGELAGKITIHNPERGLTAAPSLNLRQFEYIMGRRGVDNALSRFIHIPDDPEVPIEPAFEAFADGFDALLELQSDIDQESEQTLNGEPRVRQKAVFDARVGPGNMQVTLMKSFYFYQPKDAVREVRFILPREIPWLVGMRARHSATYGETEVAFTSVAAEEAEPSLRFDQYVDASAPRIAAMSLVLDRMAVGKEAEILRSGSIDQQRKIA